MRQQVGREGRVADQTAMRTAVRKADGRGWVLNHRLDRIVVELDVAPERRKEEGLPVLFHHPIEGNGVGGAAFARCNRGNRLIHRRLVVTVLTEPEDLFPVCHHPECACIPGQGLFCQEPFPEARITQ